MQLVIAEKPSVAQSIAGVLGATERKILIGTKQKCFHALRGRVVSQSWMKCRN